MEVIFTKWLEKKKIIKESILLDYIEKNNLKEKLQKIEPQKYVFSSIKWKELDKNIDILKIHTEWLEVINKYKVTFFEENPTKNTTSIKKDSLYEIPKEKVVQVEKNEDNSGISDKKRPIKGVLKAIPLRLLNFFKKE